MAVKPEAELEYRKILSRYFEKIRPKLKLVLGKLAARKYAAGEALSIEVHSDGFYESYFAVVFVVNVAEGTVTTGSNLLPGVNGVLPESHKKSEKKFRQKGVNTWSVAKRVFVDLVVECWKEVPGAEKVKATIQHHDDIEYCDLQDGKWKWWVKPLGK